MTKEEFFDIGRVAYITGNVQEALAAKQALETVVENANSLQQLKAEIAAIIKEFDSGNLDSEDIWNLLCESVKLLRQLSAV